MRKQIAVTILLAGALGLLLANMAEAGEVRLKSHGSSAFSYITVTDGGYATNYMTRESNFKPSANQKLTFHCTRPCYICLGNVCGAGYGPPFPADVAVSTDMSASTQACSSWDGGTVTDYCISAAPVAGADAGLTVYFFSRSGNE